jgi:predicted DNA-binding transcriptional regulator AlpA
MLTPVKAARRRYLKRAEVAKRYGVSTSTIKRWEAAGVLPRSVRPGGGAAVYLLSAIEAWERALEDPS